MDFASIRESFWLVAKKIDSTSNEKLQNSVVVLRSEDLEGKLIFQ